MRARDTGAAKPPLTRKCYCAPNPESLPRNSRARRNHSFKDTRVGPLGKTRRSETNAQKVQQLQGRIEDLAKQMANHYSVPACSASLLSEPPSVQVCLSA